MNTIRGLKRDIARQIIELAVDQGKDLTMSNGQAVTSDLLAASHTLPELRRVLSRLMATPRLSKTAALTSAIEEGESMI